MISRELRTKIRDRRAATAVENSKTVPGSVPFLRELLLRAIEPNDRDELLAELAGEYLRAGLEDEHLLVQRERVRNHPDEAVMWLGLADSLSARSDGAEEAKSAAATGLDKARNAGALIRYALVCTAQIARRTGDRGLFESALRELIDDAANERKDDCDFNEQLVTDLPAGFCTPTLEEEYRRLLQR
jgi:hypothetical protein